MYLTESDRIWQLYSEGAAEDMVTSSLTKLQAPDDIIQMFLKTQNGKLIFKPEHVTTLYTWIRDQKADVRTIESDYRDYLRFFQNEPLTNFKSYLDWTEKVHAKRDEAAYHSRHKNVGSIELEGSDKENIIEDNNEITILRGDDEHKCVKYGRGYSFCISRGGGGNMYGNYRISKASTFYFIFFKNIPKEDERHIMVLDRTADGWEWTFGKNNTQTVNGGWDEIVQQFPILAKYEDKLINKPLTPDEEIYQKKMQRFAAQPTLTEFNTFSYKEKADALKTGVGITLDIFQSLDNFLRNEWVSVGPKMSDDVFKMLSDKELDRFFTVRKQQIPQQGVTDKFDRLAIDRDPVLKERLVRESQDNLKLLLQQYRRDDVDVINLMREGLIDEHDNDIEACPYTLFLYELPDFSEFNGRVTSFYCNNNLLTSLKGLPQGVKYINCNNNQLTSLEGIPMGVEAISCDNNQLTSLEGLPQGVEYVYCDNNQLTSLEGLPQGVKYISCSNNQLTSLEGIPMGVEAISCDNNPGNFTETDIKNAKNGIFTKNESCIHNLIKSFLLRS